MVVSDEVPDELSKRILDAALELFSISGYGSVTVDEIAKQAQVGVATLYRRWDDKPALANAVYQRSIAAMRLIYVELSTTDPKDRFLELWSRLWDYAMSNPAAFLFVESHVHAAFVDHTSKEHKAILMAEATELMNSMGLKADLEVISAMVMGTAVSLTRSPNKNHDPEAIGDRLWAALRP